MGFRPDHPARDAAPLSPAALPEHTLCHRWDYHFARTLLDLQSRAWSGCVRVCAEGIGTTVYLRAGHPVFVGGGLPADSLGRVLAQRGWISESQLALVVEHRMSIQGRERFGKVALSMGLLDETALGTALDAQVRDKVARCLHWHHGELQVIEGAHDAPRHSGPPLSVEPLLLDAVSRHFDAERIAGVLEAFRPHPVSLRSRRERVAQRFQLDAEQVTLLDTLAEAPCLDRALHRLAGADAPRLAAELLCALALADQLELPETRAVTLVGLRRREAPSPAADNDQFRGLGDFARDTDGQRDAPASVASRDKLLADSAFLQGRELLRVEEFAAAADAFKTAAQLRPGAREYALYAAWAGYRAGGGSDRWRARLQAQCQGALQQDRHLSFGHHVLAQLALAGGDLEDARRGFARAVELDPGDEVATRLLTQLST